MIISRWCDPLYFQRNFYNVNLKIKPMAIETLADAYDKFRELHADYVLLRGRYSDGTNNELNPEDIEELRSTASGLRTLMGTSALSKDRRSEEAASDLMGSICDLLAQMSGYARAYNTSLLHPLNIPQQSKPDYDAQR